MRWVRTGRKPVVLHFDHGWRAESGTDAGFVHDLARQFGLKYVGAKMRASAKRHREAEARTARYTFFAKIALKLEIPHLVLAHHADDQVETFLMQLLRGSGAAGRGMDPVSERGGLILHRPWLAVWKKEIVALCEAASTRVARGFDQCRYAPSAQPDPAARAALFGKAIREGGDRKSVPGGGSCPRRERMARCLVRGDGARGGAFREDLAHNSPGATAADDPALVAGAWRDEYLLCRCGGGTRAVGSGRFRQDQFERGPFCAAQVRKDFCGVKWVGSLCRPIYFGTRRDSRPTLRPIARASNWNCGLRREAHRRPGR